MSESPIEDRFTDELDAELSPRAEAVGALIDYNHQPSGPAPDLSQPALDDEGHP